MTSVIGTFGEVSWDLYPHYLSVDPGVTSGITLWNSHGKPVHYNELDIDNMNRLLDHIEYRIASISFPLKQIIVEEFRLYQKLAVQQSGSKLETVQVVGMIKRSNYVMKLPPVAEVRADSKEIAASWSGTKMPKRGTHMENWKAAYLVGYYWLHQQGIIPARVLEEQG